MAPAVPRRRRSQSGQAAVETALTMPLAVFMILGALQMFMMLQARLMTEYAAYRAVRAGSLSQGSCRRMVQAALVTVLPTFARTDSPARLAAAFDAHSNNRYNPSQDGGRNGPIIWIYRDAPTAAQIAASPPNRADDELFDDPDQTQIMRLRARLIFWYPMRIPFANWIISKTARAAFGIQAYVGENPLMPAQTAYDWAQAAPPSGISSEVITEFGSRDAIATSAGASSTGAYVFPIQATYAMRMMTPPRLAEFSPQDCK